MERQYVCIDLKSFYASCECVQRNLDPLDTNLVVADEKRTEKTICLAVSPSLKSYYISGRARLFEVIQKVRQINAQRLQSAPGHKFSGKSCSFSELAANPSLALDYIVAPPQMALYIKYSTDIYSIYLKYVAPEDIHVYSVDEVFIDVTAYLKTYKTTPHELTLKMIRDVLSKTGITATAGIGTNMYLAKIALDIEAKKMPPDKDGVRIAELDEMSYRKKLWSHRPLTDFWRIGPGYAKKLEANGMFTMGDIARCCVSRPGGEALLYRLFGVNAELLIDHAWGYEPCTISDIKSYVPETNSISSGQVLKTPYTTDKAETVICEMADALAYDLLDKSLVTDQIVLTVGYDTVNLKKGDYKGEVTSDRYGRKIPKQTHVSVKLQNYTNSAKIIIQKTRELFSDSVNHDLLIRRLTIAANRVIHEKDLEQLAPFDQLDLFTDYNKQIKENQKEEQSLNREKNIRRAILDIKKQFGKNAVLKAVNLTEESTAAERNDQIGGHKA